MRTANRLQKVSVFGVSQRDSRWLVRWRVSGRDKSRSFTTKAQAAKFARQLENALDEGTSFDPGDAAPGQLELNSHRVELCSVVVSEGVGAVASEIASVCFGRDCCGGDDTCGL